MFNYPGEYYELIRAGYRNLEEETQFLASLLPSGGRFLDLGCGTGTNLFALARLGFRGVGIEQSQSFTDYFHREKLRMAEQWASHIEVKQESMATCSPPGEFDLVYSLFTSINHLEYDDIPSVFQMAYRVLKPGGRLVVETGLFLNLIPVFQPSQVIHQSNDNILITRLIRHSISAKAATWNHDETMLVQESGQLRMYRERYRQQILKVKEIATMVSRAGFSHVETHTNFPGHPATRDDRIVVIALR